VRPPVLGRGVEWRRERLTSGDCAVRAGGGREGWGFRGGRLEVSRWKWGNRVVGDWEEGVSRARWPPVVPGRDVGVGYGPGLASGLIRPAAVFGRYMGLLEDNTLLS
jgi:hypothetical protein